VASSIQIELLHKHFYRIKEENQCYLCICKQPLFVSGSTIANKTHVKRIADDHWTDIKARLSVSHDLLGHLVRDKVITPFEREDIQVCACNYYNIIHY
jgi:hypothetical protein